MSLTDIHGQKISAVFVIVVEFCEVAYLAAERRSGVTSENQDQRAPNDAVAESESRLAVESDQFDVGRRIADAQIAAMPARQRVAQKSIDVARAAHEITERPVACREDQN